MVTQEGFLSRFIAIVSGSRVIRLCGAIECVATRMCCDENVLRRESVATRKCCDKNVLR